MNKSFKTLLLKIARLPLRDQKWLINHLSPDALHRFNTLKGKTLLHQARKFRDVQSLVTELPDTPQALPTYCETLKDRSTLYQAIIIKQGHFPWAQNYLETQAHDVKQIAVQHIKPKTQMALLRHWQNQLTFKEQLEEHSG